MRIHQRRLAGARDGGIERLPAKAGPLVVDGGVDLRGALERGAELAGPSVESSPLRRRDRPVQDVAQELVAEVVVAVGHRGEDHVVDELLERRLERLDRQVHDPGEHVGREAATDDGSGAGRRLGLRRAVGHPREDGIVDRVGDRASRIAEPSARASALRAPSSSSMWSGIPSVRSKTAAATSREAGRPVSRISDVARAVSSRVNGRSLTSSAMRWVMRRTRQSRRLVPGGTSSIR